METDLQTKNGQSPDDLDPKEILMKYVENAHDVGERLKKGTLTDDDRNHISDLLSQERLRLLTTLARILENE